MLLDSPPPAVMPVAAASALPGLAEDLMTDWLPDAVAGAGADADGPIGPAGRLDVATAAGVRSVVLAPMPLRIRGHVLAERCLPAAEAALMPGVFGYRDAASPYRKDWTAMRVAAARAADGRPVELRFDVRGFFASVPAAALDRHGSDAGAFARAVEAEYGQCLLPGHRWARRFANVVLDDIDRGLGQPFVRWQDDYRVFLQDREEAAAVLGWVERRLGRAGLALNAAKTRICGQAAPGPDYESPLTPGWDASVAARDVPRLKFLLRQAAQDGPGDGSVPTTGVPGIVAQHPVLAPRAVWALVARAEDPRAVAGLVAVASAANPWVAARALAGFASRPSLAGAAPADAVSIAADSPHAGVRALAARLLHAQGRPFPWSLPHVDRILRSASPGSLQDVAPQVATTL